MTTVGGSVAMTTTTICFNFSRAQTHSQPHIPPIATAESRLAGGSRCRRRHCSPPPWPAAHSRLRPAGSAPRLCTSTPSCSPAHASKRCHAGRWLEGGKQSQPPTAAGRKDEAKQARVQFSLVSRASQIL
uniref:Uncharacterized protein n=1 Tax=Setaria viridis TaxID=4556 RepID=A0A4V6DDG8_SETVI|nr:hypothetical protein SEVIR_3G377300v2 [Setaria viridis]